MSRFKKETFSDYNYTVGNLKLYTKIKSKYNKVNRNLNV